MARVGLVQGQGHCIVLLPGGHIFEADIESPLSPAINGRPVVVGEWASTIRGQLHVDVENLRPC